MKRFIGTFSALILLIGFLLVPFAASSRAYQLPEVYAEALGTANLRAGPSTDYEVVGEIAAGAEYRVLAQHALVPWLLLEVPSFPRGAGWVFKDLVKITRGDLNTVPFREDFTELTSSAAALPAGTPSPLPSNAPVTPTSLPPASVVTARLIGRSNIRYGPGVDYPTIATLDEGTIMTVLATHSQYPWYKVAVEGAPNGAGWVFNEVVEIQGDISALPVITQTVLDFPTPSATPNTVVVSQPPLADFGNNSPRLAAELGEPIHVYLLSQGLAPRTDREGSVFVLDLFTNEHFTLNGGVAYSGMSINKIPVLVTYFLERDIPLETRDAELVAETMICSENTATNRMMTDIGEGDILAGAQKVTQVMRQIGLGNTFVVAPFWTGDTIGGATPTPAPVSSVTTNVDQQRTQPDLFNQITVEEIGWLLGSMYQCAANGAGPLITTFGERLTQTECRQMIRVMSANKIGALIESGVGEGAVVAHKHGWISDTHGDAGIVFGPEGAYVLAMIYHERTNWLDYEKSFPVLEEVARLTWNYFNPNFPLAAILAKPVPATCDIYAEPVIADMLSGNISIPTPPSPSAQPKGTLSPTATPNP